VQLASSLDQQRVLEVFTETGERMTERRLADTNSGGGSCDVPLGEQRVERDQ
jgi:hypothetical protein